MIDIMREKQNEYGFLPSEAGSGWLLEDYGIGPGYYDTRFNTDFWLANLNAAENFGVTAWLDRVRTYADFLMEFAAGHHFAFGQAPDEGWAGRGLLASGRRANHAQLTQPPRRGSVLPLPADQRDRRRTVCCLCRPDGARHRADRRPVADGGRQPVLCLSAGRRYDGRRTIPA